MGGETADGTLNDRGSQKSASESEMEDLGNGEGDGEMIDELKLVDRSERCVVPQASAGGLT